MSQDGQPAAKALRVSFESVSPIAYPEFYYHEHPRILASQVPEEAWRCHERSGYPEDGIWEQFNGLHKLMSQGELIRNVRLWEAERRPEAEWKDITP